MLNGYPAKRLNEQTSVFLLGTLTKLAYQLNKRGMEKEKEYITKLMRRPGETKQIRQYGGKRKPSKVCIYI